MVEVIAENRDRVLLRFLCMPHRHGTDPHAAFVGKGLHVRAMALGSAMLLSHCNGTAGASSNGTPMRCAPTYGPGWATALGRNAGSGPSIAIDALGNVPYAGVPSLDGTTTSGFAGTLSPQGVPLSSETLSETMAEAPGAGIGVASAADGGFFVIETAAAPSGSAALVSRFTSAGSAVWSHTLAWGHNDWGGTFVATDGTGGVWIVGVELATGAGGGSNLSPKVHPFLARLDSGGNVLWAETLGSLDQIYPRGLAIAPNGNALVALQVNDGSLWVNDGGVAADPSSGPLSTVASFDPDGSVGWASIVSQSQDDQLTSLAAGSDGTIYAAGTTLNGDTIGAPTTEDAFLVAFDTSGESQWRKSYSQSTQIGSPLIASRPCGGLTLAAGISSDPVNAVVVLDLDRAGTEQRRRFVTCTGGSCQVRPTGLVAQGADGVMMTGWFWGAFSFDSVSLSTTLSDDGFMLRVAD